MKTRKARYDDPSDPNPGTQVATLSVVLLLVCMVYLMLGSSPQFLLRIRDWGSLYLSQEFEELDYDLVIRINSDDSVTANGLPVAMDSIREVLEQHSTNSIAIYLKSDATNGALVSVIDQLGDRQKHQLFIEQAP